MNKTIYSAQSRLFCRQLADLRKSAGMTQRDLAAKLEREHSFVAKVELGERRLDFVKAYWYLRALGVLPGETAQRLMDLLQEHEKQA